MSLLLGIDIGTSGSKAVLIAPDGSVRAEAATEYPMAVPRPGWAEQDPEDWWAATVASIRQVLAHAGGDGIAGIGLTGQMHGLVLMDEAGKVLRPCIMWNDQRTADQCAEIEQKVGRAKLIELAGKSALTGFTAGKILWVRENEPAVYKRVRHVLLPKDYVRYRLTGAFAMDVADGSGTLLMDVGKRTWSDELLRLLDIPREWLPSLHESHEVVSEVSAASASATGLRVGTPVVAGAGDQAAQSLGTGIAGEGIVSVTIGTSGVVFAATSNYAFDPTGGLHAYCHAVPDTWHLMGVTLSAGGSLRWFRDTLCEAEKAEASRTGRDAYDIITELAATVPAGSDGLLFLPYLTGERTPHADPNARGVFFGLSLRHTKAHMARAVLEGVTFSLRECLDLLCSLGQSCTRVRVSGGGSRSTFWRQMMADVFGTEIVEVNVTQGAAYGAALLAGVGTGVYKDEQEACTRTVRETGATGPGPGASAYAEHYQRYRALYPALQPEFKAMAATVARHAPDEADRRGQELAALKKLHRFVAIDLGAESGRVVEGELEDRRLDINEVHRFRNEIINVHGRLYWDLFALFREVKQGLRLCAEEAGRRFDSIGIDTWGVDFGLLGADGSLLGMPRAYRDPEFKGAMAKFLKRVPKQRIYDLTGIQFLNINTLYQLHALKLAKSPLLAQADALLFMPDLFNYLLTGVKTTEFTIATTSQLYDPAKRAWAEELFEALGVSPGIMQEVVGPGSHIGKLRKDVCDETGFPRGSVVTTASHDTAAAVAGIPAEGDDWAFISSGTWSLVGVETRQPYMGEEALRHNFANEAGVCGTFRLLKNVTGLWLLRRCVEEWQEDGQVDYESLLAGAARVRASDTVIDPDSHLFASPQSMMSAMHDHCRLTGQQTPVTRTGWARMILNSMALKYRIVLHQLRTFYKQPINRIHIVGGGVRNRLLCQLTADATGLPVHAGPVEATAIGNLMVQAMAAGCVRDLAGIRAVVRRSFEVQVYEPGVGERGWWKSAEERLRAHLPGSKRR